MNENYMNQMPLPAKEKGGAGPVVAVVIIIILLALGAFYFWNEAKERNAGMNDTNSELQATSTRGMNAELEAELRTMQSDDLGEDDMRQVDGEFNQQ